MTAERRAMALVASALDIQGPIAATDDMHSLAAWSSLSHARLVLELEAELGRQLTGEEVAGIVSVAAVAALLAPGSVTGPAPETR